MIPLFTADQCRKLDIIAKNKYSISTEKLMENAGKQISDFILERKCKSVLIFCGKGNNGGDGLVVARFLAENKIKVSIAFATSKKELNYLSRINLEKINNENYNIQFYFKPTLQKLRSLKFEYIIDALLGTSFNGKLKSNYLEYVKWMNRQNVPIYSVDVPSGLNATTGIVNNFAVKANSTLTLGSNKIGLWIADAPNYVGKVVLKEIGLPKNIFNKIKSSIFLLEKSDVKNTFPKRDKTVHKYSVGKVFALCGSRGLTGAAILSTDSVMKSGAGAVILGFPDSEYNVIARRTLEVMTFPLVSTNEGTLSKNSFSEIETKLKWCNCLLIGPGLSKNQETEKLIQKVIELNSKPIVIDADAIYALRDKKNILLKSKSKEIILTPHLGEFQNLIGKRNYITDENRIQLGKKFALKYKVTLVLKGKPTIIFHKNGNVFMNPIGNEGMATAGSGDVLSGIISSLLSQGNRGIESAINGVYIHSLSGDISAKEKTIYSLVASDLIKNIPKAIKYVIN